LRPYAKSVTKDEDLQTEVTEDEEDVFLGSVDGDGDVVDG
jgi:hypothetical protein